MTAKSWNSGTADWTTTADWTPTGAPGSGDDVTIAMGNPQIHSSVGTVHSITDSADLLVYNGGGLTVTTFVNNSGTFDVDNAYVGGNTGGSTVTIGGALTNSGTTDIGSRLINEATMVSAASLSNTGTLNIIAGTAPATLVIGSAAGFGQAGVLTGTVFLEGAAKLQFASGAITKIAAGASLTEGSFNGNATESIAIAGQTGQNSAIRTLAENDGTFNLDNGPSITLSGGLKNTGSLGVDGGYVGLPDGGSALTIGGTLTNTGTVAVGNTLISTTSTLKVNALSSTGTVDISGGSQSDTTTPLASIVVAGAAGLGATGHVTGQLNLLDDALLQFASGGFTQIDAGAQLSLNGALSRVTSGSAAATSTGLTGLKENDGTFILENGATVTTAAGTNFVNAGTTNIDYGYYSPSGSTLTIGGNLSNTGQPKNAMGQPTGFAFNIGAGSNGVTTVNVLGTGGVSNTGTITLNGDTDAGTSSQVTLDLVHGQAGFGTAGHVTGTVSLTGDALVEFAGGAITQIDSGATLSITGAEARVALAGSTTTNSALTRLKENDGTLSVASGVKIVEVAGTAFTNTGTLDLDAGYGQSGSTIAFGSTLTNSGTILLGNGAQTSAFTVSATGLVNTGTIHLYGEPLAPGAAGTASTLAINGATSGTGTIILEYGAKLVLKGAVASGQTVAFGQLDNTLALGAPGAFKGAVTGFATGDIVDLSNETVLSASYSGSVLTVTLAGGVMQTFDIAGSAAGFGFTTDGSGGTELVSAISVATYEANRASFDAQAGGIALADTAAAIVGEIPAIQNALNIDAIILTGGAATDTAAFSIGHATTLDLGTSALTLAGSASFPASSTASTLITGSSGATLVTQGATSVGTVTLGDLVVWQNTGTITQTGALQIGDGTGQIAQFDNLSSGTYNLAGDVGIAVGSNKASTFDNNGGTLSKTSGTGTSVVAVRFQDSGNTASAIKVASGTLSFTGVADSFVHQAISGSGTFAIGGGSSTIGAGTTIATTNWAVRGAGTSVTVGENLSYAGTFTQGAGTTLALTGGYLLLSGNATFAGATVAGSQRLYAEGAATAINGLTIGGTAVFETTKVARQAAGTVTIGDSSGSTAILVDYTGATYAITDNSGIAHGAAAGSYILNQGLFEKTGGTGTSTVAASFVDTGSVLVVANGTLAFTGPSNGIAGSVGGAGTVLFGGGNTLLKSGTSLGVAHLAVSGAVLSVATNLTYGGVFTEGAGSVLSLTGGYLLLSGTASLAGTVNGSQRLYAEGTSTTIAGLTIGGTAVLETTKAVTQAGGTVTVGDTTSSAAVLYTYGGSVYSIADDSSIARGTAAGSYILDQGTLQKTGGTGTSTIAPNIVNNTSAAGTVGVTSGTLDLGGTLSGNLTLAIGAGATLILEKSAAAGAAAGFSGSTGTLQLGDAQDYRGSIAGFAGGTTLDLRSIGFGAGTTTTLGYSGTTSSGTLTVSDGTRTANLSMIGSYTKASFALAGDSHGGSAITLA